MKERVDYTVDGKEYHREFWDNDRKDSGCLPALFALIIAIALVSLVVGLVRLTQGVQ